MSRRSLCLVCARGYVHRPQATLFHRFQKTLRPFQSSFKWPSKNFTILSENFNLFPGTTLINGLQANATEKTMIVRLTDLGCGRRPVHRRQPLMPANISRRLSLKPCPSGCACARRMRPLPSGALRAPFIHRQDHHSKNRLYVKKMSQRSFLRKPAPALVARAVRGFPCLSHGHEAAGLIDELDLRAAVPDPFVELALSRALVITQ